MSDQQALSRVLRQFARTMAGSYDITRVLYDLSDSVVDVLGANAAGVALLEGDDLRFITATDERAAEAERLQEGLQSGPCLASIHENRPVPVADMADAHDRWPDYAPQIEDIGFRAVLGFPLVLDDVRVGSLDVYSVEPRQWDDAVIEAGLALADIGAAYVLNASAHDEVKRTADQLQTALDTRVVIEQAKGVLAERIGISTTEAFNRIRAAARRESTKIGEVCRRVIDTGYVPD